MKDDIELIVIGASGGIGQKIVEAFSGEAKIFGTYFRSPPGELVGGERYFKVDVTDPASAQEFFEEISPALRRPVLVYAPGVSINGVAHRVRDEDWHRTMAVNLSGAMIACRGVLPRMRELGFGRIILVSSVLARAAVPGTMAYSATKAALCSMARVIAVENAQKGITANALTLGYYDVGMIATVPEDYLNMHVLPGIPMGRLGHPANIVSAIRFIVAADYFSGVSLDINGGMIAG